MGFNSSQLEPRLRAIFRSPNTNLETISAKRVRKQLLQESLLTEDAVNENKKEIDAFITHIYQEVRSELGLDEDEDDAEEEGEAEDAKEEEEERPAPSRKPAKRKRSGKNKTEETDAELARKLSTELNGRPRSAKKATGPKRGTKRKSAETVDSGDEDGERPKKRGGGFSKEYTLSEPLAALLSVQKMSRPQVVKQLWVHIRGQNLQNPQDKREIICDEHLKAVFGVDKMNMFTMSKLLGQHLHKVEA